jgi:hypothetical protein
LFRSSLRFHLRILLALLSTTAAMAHAQDFREEMAPNTPPTNLQVLPKTISNYNLVALMKQYKAQLGVKCSYCHAESSTPHKLDFASDAKPEKKTARLMMTLTNDLNSKYLVNLPTGHPGERPAQVNCGTCHRGHEKPEAWVPPVDQ